LYAALECKCMRVAVISDTHIPSRADAMPGWIREEVRAAGHMIHAGDFDAAETLAAFEDLAGGMAKADAPERPEDAPGETLTAVAGNADPASFSLPEVATVDLGGVRFVVTHGTGSSADYEERVADIAREHAGDADAVVSVSGHTHEVLDADADAGDVRLLNPGSAAGVDPATEATAMRVEAADGEVDVTVRRA